MSFIAATVIAERDDFNKPLVRFIIHHQQGMIVGGTFNEGPITLETMANIELTSPKVFLAGSRAQGPLVAELKFQTMIRASKFAQDLVDSLNLLNLRYDEGRVTCVEFADGHNARNIDFLVHEGLI